MPSHTCTQSKTKTSALAAARKCSIFVFCNKKNNMLYEVEAIKCTRANRVFFLSLATALSHPVKLLWQQELKLQFDVATAQRLQFILCYFILMLLTIIR